MTTERESVFAEDALIDADSALGRLCLVLPSVKWRFVRDQYRMLTGHRLHLVLPGGQCHEGGGRVRAAGAHWWMLVTEALRWGSPAIRWTSEDAVGWGFPVMMNDALVGGLVVEGVAIAEGEEDGTPNGAQLTRDAETLRELCLENNLCHRGWLDACRDDERRERKRAETIHSVKGRRNDSVREIYLRLEPDLLHAIREGDRPRARTLLNEVLTVIYYFGEDRIEVLKSYLMELIVVMNRTAVEAGANPSQVLGSNFSQLSELYALSDEEELSTWSRRMLEALIDAIRDHRQCTPSMLIAQVQAILRDHLGDDIGRDDVARMVGISPSHFSRQIKQKTGITFSEMFLRTRIEKARILLRQSELPVGAIAETCGFYDQSYFSKMFRKSVGVTPVAYRNRR